MTPDLSGVATTSVGLVTSLVSGALNVMSAEWTYLVAKDPLHVAVGLTDDAMSQAAVLETGEFGVTLCSDDQAGLAAFAGSFSVTEVDKTGSHDFTFVASQKISVPCVSGGLLRAECRVVHTVALPGYQLIIGEALAWTVDEDLLGRPLVKHGAMFGLGGKIAREKIIVGATAGPDTVRVGMVGPVLEEGQSWTVELFDRTRTLVASLPATFENGVDLVHLVTGGHEVATVRVRDPEGRSGLATVGRAGDAYESAAHQSTETDPDGGAS